MSDRSDLSLASIVLAAGSGRRLGMPKVVYQTGGRSFLERILDALRAAGCGNITVVVAEETREPIARFAENLRIVVNPTPELGMLSSIRIGMDNSLEADGFLLIPVDHPFVKPETIRSLTAAFIAHPDAVIKPSFHGRNGHPIIVPRKLYALTTAHAQAENLREIIHASEMNQIIIPVEDEGILYNINTAEDLPLF